MAMNRQKVERRARQFVKKGHNRKAIQEYQKLLQADPADVRSLHKIADLLVKEGDRRAAVETFLQVAEIYSRLGYQLRAVAIYKQVLRMDATRADVRCHLAEEYARLGFKSEAVHHLHSVAARLERKGQDSELLQVLERLVQLDPADADRRIRLAQMYSRTRQHDRALQEFTRAALDLRSAMRINDFLDVGERVLSLGEGNVELLIALARIYLERHDVPKALQRLKLALRADPGNIETLKLLAETFGDTGQTDKAVAVYREMARMYAEQDQMENLKETLQWIKKLQEGSRPVPAPRDGEITLPRAENPYADVHAALDDLPELSANEFVLIVDPQGYAKPRPLDQVTVRVALESLRLPRRTRPGPEDDEDFREALAEADFFIGQDLLPDAVEILEELSKNHLGHPEIEARLEEIFRLEGAADQEVTEITSRAFMSLCLEEG